MSTSLTLISLNTWGGMGGAEKIQAFFEKYQATDIFCLQEIYNGGDEERVKNAAGRSLETVNTQLLATIQAVLPEHVAYFRSQYVPYFGITILIRKTLKVLDEGSICVYREPGYVSEEDVADHARFLQHLTFETPTGPMTVFNIHGAWQAGGKGKTDTSERLDQSTRIVDFTNRFSHPLVMAGDFNLTLNSRSVELIEQAGWENLIRANGITSTRTSVYDKPEKFADYVFVKNGVQVENFQILPEEVSDHVGMRLEYSV